MSERILVARFDLDFVATGETVTDVEALCRGVMNAERWPIYLEPFDNEELLTHLLGEAVIQERRYRRVDGIEARPWLFQRLRFRARDWRDAFERHRTLPELPDLAGDDRDGGLDTASGHGGGSHGSAGEIAGDRGDPGTDALRRLLESGDRALLREIEALGLGPPPGARGRSPDARRRLEALDRDRRRRVARLLEREQVAA